ncbi:MAG: DUF3105 domain-containing protein [Alphaproteobacteria bacterium]|nr:DUF3105 domain-containing protein [Alphaproteobacteria bacterium]
MTGPIAYDRDFPTSGPHSPTWTVPGVYDRPQAKSELVHALEHGHIVVYFDRPSPEAWRQLTDWAGLFSGKWDGLVVTPYPGLDETMVMTAWNRTLRLDAWNGMVAAAFIDAYRGRGPENPVR